MSQDWSHIVRAIAGSGTGCRCDIARRPAKVFPAWWLPEAANRQEPAAASRPSDRPTSSCANRETIFLLPPSACRAPLPVSAGYRTRLPRPCGSGSGAASARAARRINPLAPDHLRRQGHARRRRQGNHLALDRRDGGQRFLDQAAPGARRQQENIGVIEAEGGMGDRRAFMPFRRARRSSQTTASLRKHQPSAPGFAGRRPSASATPSALASTWASCSASTTRPGERAGQERRQFPGASAASRMGRPPRHGASSRASAGASSARIRGAAAADSRPARLPIWQLQVSLRKFRPQGIGIAREFYFGGLLGVQQFPLSLQSCRPRPRWRLEAGWARSRMRASSARRPGASRQPMRQARPRRRPMMTIFMGLYQREISASVHPCNSRSAAIRRMMLRRIR